MTTVASTNGSNETDVGTQRVKVYWNVDESMAANHANLGVALASTGGLFRRSRNNTGLLLTRPDQSIAYVTDARDLAAMIVDRIDLTVVRGGKIQRADLPLTTLGTVLRSDSFLSEFMQVDYVSTVPLYLPDFSLTRPGLNDGGSGFQVLHLGGRTRISESTKLVDEFLSTMEFATNADRTNAVAAALTVMVRHRWPGQKPIILVTATKSQAGKDTIIDFAVGETAHYSLSYQSTDWALTDHIVSALEYDPSVAVLVLENVRLIKGELVIASAFVERLTTSPSMLLKPRRGKPFQWRNDAVIAISTNYGSVSADIANRSLPIRLKPVGDVRSRVSSIGNPRFEFLPANVHIIAAELRGMIQRWLARGAPRIAGMPHTFTDWAATIAGILDVNGYRDFLGNFSDFVSRGDPVRLALATLGGHTPDQWLSVRNWCNEVARLGLTGHLIPPTERESDESRVRRMGVVLSAHKLETFAVETETHQLTLRLDNRRSRDRGEAKPRYRFTVVGKTPIISESDSTEPSDDHPCDPS